MRRLIALATLSVVLVTCLVTWARTPKGLTKLEAAKKLLMDPRVAKKLIKKGDPQEWEARLSESRAQVEARLLEERKTVAKRVELFIKKSPITFE